METRGTARCRLAPYRMKVCSRRAHGATTKRRISFLHFCSNQFTVTTSARLWTDQQREFPEKMRKSWPAHFFRLQNIPGDVMQERERALHDCLRTSHGRCRFVRLGHRRLPFLVDAILAARPQRTKPIMTIKSCG